MNGNQVPTAFCVPVVHLHVAAVQAVGVDGRGRRSAPGPRPTVHSASTPIGCGYQTAVNATRSSSDAVAAPASA